MYTFWRKKKKKADPLQWYAEMMMGDKAKESQSRKWSDKTKAHSWIVAGQETQKKSSLVSWAIKEIGRGGAC